MAETLPDRFELHLRESGLLGGARTLAVACSGGGDSTALLLLAVGWGRPRGIAVTALHVAHGLRGEAGLVDARFCADLCARLDVPYGFLSVDVPAGGGRASASHRPTPARTPSCACGGRRDLLTGHARRPG